MFTNFVYCIVQGIPYIFFGGITAHHRIAADFFIICLYATLSGHVSRGGEGLGRVITPGPCRDLLILLVLLVLLDQSIEQYSRASSDCRGAPGADTTASTSGSP